jgi:hypothetical protein
MVTTRVVRLAMISVLGLLVRFTSVTAADAALPGLTTVKTAGVQSAFDNQVGGPATGETALDVCYDLSLWDLAACRKAIVTPTQYYRSPPDECYDVPLMELANCRESLKTPARYYRSPPDECYDVALLEYALCRKSLRARSGFVGK